jgi:hypothetical protein
MDVKYLTFVIKEFVGSHIINVVHSVAAHFVRIGKIAM